jgi:hypothetical protein
MTKCCRCAKVITSFRDTYYNNSSGEIFCRVCGMSALGFVAKPSSERYNEATEKERRIS